MNKMFYWSLLLSLMLMISCGSEDDDNDDVVEVTPPVEREEETRDNDNDENAPNRTIRWSAIELLTDDPWIEMYTQTLRMDLNRRPVIITGAFVDEPDEETTGETKTCNFQVTLSEAEADKLEAKADKLRLCTEDTSGEEEEVIDGAFNTITVTDNQGNVSTGTKFKYYDVHMRQTWVCKGRSSFYKYLKKVVKEDMPANCPDQDLRRF